MLGILVTDFLYIILWKLTVNLKALQRWGSSAYKAYAVFIPTAVKVFTD